MTVDYLCDLYVGNISAEKPVYKWVCFPWSAYMGIGASQSASHTCVDMIVILCRTTKWPAITCMLTLNGTTWWLILSYHNMKSSFYFYSKPFATMVGFAQTSYSIAYYPNQKLLQKGFDWGADIPLRNRQPIYSLNSADSLSISLPIIFLPG